MIVAAARLTLIIPDNDSLKGKRKVVKSLIEKVRHRFEAAVAEVGDNDLWQKATGRRGPGGQRRRNCWKRRLQQIMKYIENQHLAEIIDSQVELCYLKEE